MKKLLEFGRKAMLYVRVLSGYEERRIRSLKLQLQQRIQSAQQKREALRKIPEQLILSEVRRMVEEMQNLNKSLEETETAINKYFEPIDKEAQTVVGMQLKKDKSRMQMMAAMYKQALYEKVEQEAAAEVNKAKAIISQRESENASTIGQEAQMR
ncbi:hypothetical protein AKJ16_DCAP10599 [Drosera capensis]